LLFMLEIRRDGEGIFFEGDVRSGSVTPTVLGCLERWYEGGAERRYLGIRVEDEGLELPGLLVPGDGIPLGSVGFFGVGFQDGFYDERSALIGAAVVTYADRREFVRTSRSLVYEPSGRPSIEVSKDMPKRMLTIFSDSEAVVVEAAEIFGLPCEM